MAVALLAILVVVVMLVFMIVAMALLAILMVVMMLMLMVVAAALAIFVVMVMFMLVVMAAALAVLVMMVMLVLMVMTAAAVLVMIVVMMMLMLHVQHDGAAGLDDLQHHLSRQLVPGGGDDAHAGMGLLDQAAALLHAVSGEHLGAAEDDGIGGLDLIQEELAEVLHVHAGLAGVHDGRAAGDFHFGMIGLALLHRSDDLAQLANAAGLDDQAVGVVLRDQLVHGLLEVAHQGAADAAGVQLIHDDTGILHERAVHAHVAVLVLQQDDLLALDGSQQLLDQSRLARAQEAGNNIDLDHVHISISIIFLAVEAHSLPHYIIAPSRAGYKGDFDSFFHKSNSLSLKTETDCPCVTHTPRGCRPHRADGCTP